MINCNQCLLPMRICFPRVVICDFSQHHQLHTLCDKSICMKQVSYMEVGEPTRRFGSLLVTNIILPW